MDEASGAGRGLILGDVDVMARGSLNVQVAYRAFLDAEDRMID